MTSHNFWATYFRGCAPRLWSYMYIDNIYVPQLFTALHVFFAKKSILPPGYSVLQPIHSRSSTRCGLTWLFNLVYMAAKNIQRCCGATCCSALMSMVRSTLSLMNVQQRHAKAHHAMLDHFRQRCMQLVSVLSDFNVNYLVLRLGSQF